MTRIRRARRAGARDESGAYLILYALLGVAFVTIAAIVLDIAALRHGRRADRAAADLAVTAGVAELAEGDPTSFAGACEAAWGYVVANRNDSGGTTTPPDCGATFPAVACDPVQARTAEGSIGPLTVQITHPVPDASPLMRAETPGGDLAQPVQVSSDGTPCQRLGVRIVRTRTFLFPAVAGAVGGTTDVHAVARTLATQSTTEFPALVALHPTSCRTVDLVTAAAELRIGTAAAPGILVSDTDASGCAMGEYAIDVRTAGRLIAEAPLSQIRSYALAGPSFAFSHDPGAVPTRLSPQPAPALVRTGRALLDNRYRCATCPGGDRIATFRDARDGPGVPSGAVVYSGADCAVGPAGRDITDAHVVFDCGATGLLIEGPLRLTGTAATVWGDVQITNSGCLAIGGACGDTATSYDSDLYVRGRLAKATGGRLTLLRTFVMVEGELAIGVDTDTTGLSNSALIWSAPEAGDFEDLLLWSEANAPILLGEQKFTSLVGTLAAPAAEVTLNPRDGGVGVDAQLQVVAQRVRVSGDGLYRLRPSATRATGALTRQVRLIR